MTQTYKQEGDISEVCKSVSVLRFQGLQAHPEFSCSLPLAAVHVTPGDWRFCSPEFLNPCILLLSAVY